MRKLFAFLVACLVSGCYLSHERATVDAAVPVSDAGAVPDAGPLLTDAGVPTLIVSLSEFTPPGRTVAKGSSYVAMVAVDFEAVGANIPLRSLAFERLHFGARSAFSNAYLFDMTEERTRITSGRTIDPITDLVTFPGLSVVVPDGGARRLWLFVDISMNASTGNQHAFRLANADAVATIGRVSVIGEFPIDGNTMLIASVAANQVIFRAGSGPDIVSGERGVISHFRAFGDMVGIDAITLTQNGSISMSDLVELELYADGVRVADPRIDGQRIILDFGEYPLSGWSDFLLIGRVGGPRGRTIRTYIEYPVDVRAIDTHLNLTAAVCISPLAMGGCSTEGDGSFDGTSPGAYMEITTR